MKTSLTVITVFCARNMSRPLHFPFLCFNLSFIVSQLKSEWIKPSNCKSVSPFWARTFIRLKLIYLQSGYVTENKLHPSVRAPRSCCATEATSGVKWIQLFESNKSLPGEPTCKYHTTGYPLHLPVTGTALTPIISQSYRLKWFPVKAMMWLWASIIHIYFVHWKKDFSVFIP